ncbi:aryl-sulfate sulfotransferase [Halocatena pleomorpha]|uniref:Arylsulfotransferase (Asst) n=1 Tax=Halocatena pleomorpha TaxID=1785090 RepID=A0A3P3RAC8_9EURY|nr:aryl-sulfate sulfotransferase [Halocatena pleomorpha]RRJ30335.1 hypothetical protein EIK79_10470 [Halocatena pleomorpha]
MEPKRLLPSRGRPDPSSEPVDRRPRMVLLGTIILLCAVVVVLGAVSGERSPSPPGEANASLGNTDTDIGYAFDNDTTGILSPGNTLITIQTHDWFGSNSGAARIVAPNGTTVWTYDQPNSRVFDGEVTDNDTVLMSVATEVTGDDCPEAYRSGAEESCVHNRVVELDPADNTVVWEYDWYDAFIAHHEVHDADRLDDGQTAIIDMGNSRAFTVDQDGDITWSWNATDHLSAGSAFQEQYGGPPQEHPEADWTHMNDIDKRPNGNFQLSIRNFDAVLEVDPRTNDIVDVIGKPGNTDLLNQQHNPQRLDNDTMLVADSENNRVIELDTDTEEIHWLYDGPADRGLQWPRDADRLPNGNTLVTDSRNFRVLEINPNGTIVWRYSLRDSRGIVYEADRLGVPEESVRDLTHRNNTTIDRTHPLINRIQSLESWAGFVFPGWVRLEELIAILCGSLASLGLLWQFVIGWLRGDRLY